MLQAAIVFGVSAVVRIIPPPPIPAACKAMPGFSIFQGGTVASYANVTSPAACCALCEGNFKDECAGWEWVNLSLVHADHDCDIMAKIGPPATFPGRISGVVAHRPPSVGLDLTLFQATLYPPAPLDDDARA